MDLFLAKAYLKCGRTEEAQNLLEKEFQLSIEMHKDHADWKDRLGYHILSKLLFMAGHEREASILQCLRRFYNYDPNMEKAILDAGDDGKGENPNDEDDDQQFSRWLDCSLERSCPNYNIINPKLEIYSCMTCFDTSFCENCYKQYINNDPADQQRLYLCHPTHKQVKTPVERWTLKKDAMTIDGKQILVSSWLEAMEKLWHEAQKPEREIYIGEHEEPAR
jgi:hypothetical protein